MELKMGRKNRFDYISDDSIVHVRMQINNGEYRFSKDEHFRLWKRIVIRYSKKYKSIKVTGYQWMSNHCHLMLEVKIAEDLPKFMHNINWMFAREFNKLEQRKGHVFQNRYQATVIKTNEQEMICQRYIHRNQLRAGMAKSSSELKWTSYHHYAFGISDPIITDNFRTYDRLGNTDQKRQIHFQEFVNQMTYHEENEFKTKLKKYILYITIIYLFFLLYNIPFYNYTSITYSFYY